MKARDITIKDGVGFVPLGKNAKQGYALISADDVYKVEMNSWRLDSRGYAIKSVKENRPYPGVRRLRNKKTGRAYDTWEVTIKFKEKFQYTGYFDNVDDAIKKRKELEKQLYGSEIDRRSRSSWGV